MGERVLFHIDSAEGGIPRDLAEGISTTIFPGDEAMVSVVRVAPNAEGMLHDHPEEQWGMLISGSATRVQGETAFEVVPGSLWRTPGGVPHTIKAGPEGAVILDIFAPPRAAYLKPGAGFGDDRDDKEG